MFTVLHRRADGSESLHTAKTIDKVETGDRFADGIFLDLKPLDCATEIGAPTPPREFSHVIHFDHEPWDPASPAFRHTPEVFVMNEAGATVARYRL